MLTYHPSMVQPSLLAINDQLHDVYHKIELTMSAAQLHRLTPLLLDHDVLLLLLNILMPLPLNTILFLSLITSMIFLKLKHRLFSNLKTKHLLLFYMCHLLNLNTC